MKKIFKIKIGREEWVRLPVGAKIVKFDMQYQYFCVWYEFDTDVQILESVLLSIHGTGHPIPKNQIYVQTCFDDRLVWHLYYSTLDSNYKKEGI